VLTNTQPLIAALLARAFLREELAPRQGLGLALAFLGIVAISLPHLAGAGRVSFARGSLYIALAVGGVAYGNVLMKAVRLRVDPLVAMSTQTLLGAVPLALAPALREQPSTIAWSAQSIGTLLALGLLATALANWLWFVALGRLPLSEANAFNFLTPLIGFFIGITFFSERMGWESLIGLALTVVGIGRVERRALVSADRP
jgi:drug/metabolite transporter (DMT)-like permease